MLEVISGNNGMWVDLSLRKRRKHLPTALNRLNDITGCPPKGKINNNDKPLTNLSIEPARLQPYQTQPNGSYATLRSRTWHLEADNPDRRGSTSNRLSRTACRCGTIHPANGDFASWRKRSGGWEAYRRNKIKAPVLPNNAE